MNLSAVTTPNVAANTRVVDALRSAQTNAAAALRSIETTGFGPVVAATVRSASTASEQALAGARQLGADNVLEPAAHRYAQHAARDLAHAASVAGRAEVSGDALAILVKALGAGEISARLGAEAGARSLTSPVARPSADGSPSSGAGTGSPASGGATWVDGQWIDGIGNPVRGGGDSWSGPDGQTYGSDGGVTASPGRGDYDGGWSGPDGSSYSGI